MKRASLSILCLFVLLIPISLSAAEPPSLQGTPCSPEASLAAIFSAEPALSGNATSLVQELPAFLPEAQPKLQYVDCTSFCRQHGNVCRFSGGFCGRVCDEEGNCGCNCFYP